MLYNTPTMPTVQIQVIVHEKRATITSSRSLAQDVRVNFAAARPSAGKLVRKRHARYRVHTRYVSGNSRKEIGGEARGRGRGQGKLFRKHRHATVLKLFKLTVGVTRV